MGAQGYLNHLMAIQGLYHMGHVFFYFFLFLEDEGHGSFYVIDIGLLGVR